jgi:DNA-damage-inducible protein J
MAATAIVRVSIPTDVKETAKSVAAEMGFTLSDIVRLTLTRVAKDRALPFDVKVPNAATRAAMKENRKIMATDITSRRKK